MRPPQRQEYAPLSREELLPFLPDARSVLDVGCGSGAWGRTLRDALGTEARLVGVEAVAHQAELARHSGFDEVHVGYFPDDLSLREQFDLITFNDVLEHTLDPWSVMASAHRYLTPGGRVLASVPSIQFAPIVLKLIRGRWDYTDDGTLDRTHVRFFTKATMIEMFEQAGFRVERVGGINRIGQSRVLGAGPLVRGGVAALRRIAGDAQYSQFVLVGSPSAERANIHMHPSD